MSTHGESLKSGFFGGSYRELEWEQEETERGFESDIRTQSSEELKQARMLILAAKAAYQFKSPRWLSLFARAMDAIEQCPQHLHEYLKTDLCAFHSEWSKKPQSSYGMG